MNQFIRLSSISFSLFFFCFSQIGISQNVNTIKYISVAFIKSKSSDFTSIEKEFWVPVHKQLVKEGRKVAWYLYKVKFPTGKDMKYDYVRFNVFTEWKQVEAPYGGLSEIIKKAHPTLDPKDYMARSDQSRELVSEQLFQLIDQAADKIKNPAQFIIVNEMKPIAGSEDKYVELERKYFKPFHAARVEAGVMNNWGFYKRALPYGAKFDYDYVTYNGFMTWEDIIKNNPEGLWKKVHGNVNFNEIHSEILSKRITVNNELWELVAFAVE